MKYDLKGHKISQKVILFCDIFFGFWKLQECQHYENTNFPWNESWPQRSSKVIKEHFYDKIILALSFIDRVWWKFVGMLISWRHNFLIKSYMTWNMLLLCYGEVLWFFLLKPCDLMTTLTYVLMDNFCPCFFSFCK